MSLRGFGADLAPDGLFDITRGAFIILGEGLDRFETCKLIESNAGSTVGSISLQPTRERHGQQDGKYCGQWQRDTKTPSQERGLWVWWFMHVS
jgi:hypothetical protein